MAKIREMISKEEAQEIWKAVEAANDGYWFPLASVIFCFGLVIFLLLRIYAISQKANEERHRASEELISDLVKSKNTNDLILQELKMITQSHDRDIERIKDNQ